MAEGNLTAGEVFLLGLSYARACWGPGAGKWAMGELCYSTQLISSQSITLNIQPSCITFQLKTNNSH